MGYRVWTPFDVGAFLIATFHVKRCDSYQIYGGGMKLP